MGSEVNLKLSKAEMKEISVFLPKDVKSISDNKDFSAYSYDGGKNGVDCVNMDSYSVQQLRDIRIVLYLFQ